MERISVTENTGSGGQDESAGHEASAQTTGQPVRIVLIVAHELVETVYERAVVEHVVGVDRVAHAVVVELAFVDEREAEVVGRGAALANEKQAVERRGRRRGRRRG